MKSFDEPATMPPPSNPHAPRRRASRRGTLSLPTLFVRGDSFADADLVSDLIRIAAARYRVIPTALLSTTRAAPVCRARNAVWRALRFVGWSYPAIAEAFAYDCHGTIMNGCKNAAAYIRHQDPLFEATMHDLTTYLLNPTTP